MRLKYVVFSVCLAIQGLGINNAYAKQILTSLEQLEWSNRIVIVQLVSETELKQAVNTLEQANFEIEDRDIIWLAYTQNKLTSNYDGTIKQQFHQRLLSNTSSDTQQIMLIGKDGGIKHQSNSLDLVKIFSLIDQMPMRIAEMNEGK